MANEQGKTLAALQAAIQMEIDGKAYYLKASRESRNELGKKLLESLAAEEDIHRQKFEEIYNSLRNKSGWPKIDFKPDGGKHLRTIFAQITKAAGPQDKALSTELDAVDMALKMETQSYELYHRQSQQATSDAEKEFYQKLAAEEREHHLVLTDYREYLQDPSGWFTRTEHPSLDGG